ncbi:MAG: C1 family peptidase [Methanomicrobiales archaeon]|nr:C1 family peptidase [Methanomicrobiales archaeon]
MAIVAAALAAIGSNSSAQAELPGMGFLPVSQPGARGSYEAGPFTSGNQTRDLRDEGVITPAKHQGSCGACWAFAAITCVETACLLSDPSLDAATFDLSEQQLISCDTEVWELEFGSTRNYGCQGGSAVTFEYMRRYGIATEASYPYTSGGGSSGTCPAAAPEPSGWQVLEWDFVRPDAGVPSVTELKDALDAHGAIWVGFVVYEDFLDDSDECFWYDAAPGEIYRHTSGDRVGAHAVALIGYDDLQGCWIAKNSWGEAAGPAEDGTFRIAYESNCSFGLNAAWASVGYFGAPSPALDTTWGGLKLLFADRD